ncbi:MAG: hypothetical protein ACP5QO_17520, partial [Clostridia bacterium]
LAQVSAALLSRSEAGAADRIGKRLIRWGLAPVVFGLIAAPALMLAPGPFGWSLGLSPSIFRGFPDFLGHLDREMVFYFLFSDSTGMQVLRCRVSGRRLLRHSSSYHRRRYEDGRPTEDPARES